MYYYFDQETRLIQQKKLYLIYNIKKNQFHLINEGFKIFIDYIKGNKLKKEIISDIANEFDEEPQNISEDFDSVVTFLTKKNYARIVPKTNNSKIIIEYQNNPEIKLVRAQVKITNKCNLNCSYCFAEPNGQSKDISANEWINILDSWYKKGLRILTITGGEPFIRKDIFQILDYLNNRFIIELNTNAALIDKNCASKLSKYNIKTVMVSLDSLNAGFHDRNRGHGSWEKAIQGINNLKKNNLPISISTTFTKENESELNSFIDYCKSNKFDYNPDIIINIPGNESILEPTIISHNTINKIKANNDSFSTGSFNIGCQVNVGFANFSNTGKLKPCDISDDFFLSKKDSLLLSSDSEVNFHETEIYNICKNAENQKNKENNIRCVYNCNLSKFFNSTINEKN